MTVKNTQQTLNTTLEKTEQSLIGLETALENNVGGRSRATEENIGLPEGWANCQIADIAEVNPKKIDADPDIISGFVPMSHAPTSFQGRLKYDEKPWGDIKKSYTNFKDNDVIFAKVTPCFENGKAVVVSDLPNGIGAGSSEFYVLRAHEGCISERLIFALIKTYQFAQEGATNMTGAVGLRRVPRAFVESFPVALPPLAEQTVIAQTLDTLLAQVDNIKTRLDAIPSILKTFRQSVLAAAVSGKLTEEWRGENDYIDITQHYSAPSVWRAVNINAVIEYVTSGSRGWAAYYADEGSLFIRSQDINTDELDIVDAAYVALPEKAEGRRTKVKKEDLLVTITGANVTKCARVKVELNDAYISQHVALIRLKDSTSANFIELVLKSGNAGRKQLTDMAYGGGKPGLNLQNIKDVEFSLPSAEEQIQIVRRVEELFAFADRIEQQVKNAQGRVNNLTQSILAKAFRGELTAQWRAQNSNLISGENSAEALLAKIQAERDALKKSSKPKKKSTAK